MKIYVIEFKGDLDDPPWATDTLSAALEYLAEEKGYGKPAKDYVSGYEEDAEEILVPDPEDDRILIWEVEAGTEPKVVWHFSGWHWDSTEFGIDQGKLPGHDKSLMDLAMEDY